MQFPLKLLPVLLSILLLASCSNVTVDNPSKTSMVVTLDGESHDIPAGGNKAISLKAGNHSLTIKEVTGKTILDSTINVVEGGVINVGQGDYVVWKMLYGLQTNRETLLKEEWVEMDSTEFFGDITRFGPKEFYLEKAWDYGLDQSFPSSQKLLIFSDFIIESKIFRQEDFEAEYRKMATQ